MVIRSVSAFVLSVETIIVSGRTLLSGSVAVGRGGQREARVLNISLGGRFCLDDPTNETEQESPPASTPLFRELVSKARFLPSWPVEPAGDPGVVDRRLRETPVVTQPSVKVLVFLAAKFAFTDPCEGFIDARFQLGQPLR